MAEELYQKLTSGESVHLLDWPKVGHVNEPLVHDMAKVREAINQGLSLRAGAGIKVRQPLSSVRVYGLADQKELVEIIVEELNVKSVHVVPKYKVEPGDSFTDVVEKGKEGYNNLDIKVELDLELTPELKQEGLMREIIRAIQNARKAAGLDVDDRIHVDLFSTDKSLTEAVETYKNVISQEVLAVSLSATSEHYTYTQVVKVEGHELKLSLERAN